MIEFKEPQLSDKPWIARILENAEERGCEYNFTNLYVWRGAYTYQVARLDTRLLVRLQGFAGLTYLWPVGTGELLPALEALFADAAAQGEPFRMACLTETHTQQLEECFPDTFLWEPDRDGFDYLYDINRLADLGGKKLHAKRNHINRFTETNPDWVGEPITPANLPECLAMDEEWYRRSHVREGTTDEEDLGHECVALRTAIDHFVALGLEGRLIRVYGEVVAFTMGDMLSSDTYDVHFEKAYSELQGAYAAINQEFARWLRQQHPEIHYLNREDDMGVEGLRKAKESYYPDLLVEKYIALEKKSNLSPQVNPIPQP